jgi:hypothetical protein
MNRTIRGLICAFVAGLGTIPARAIWPPETAFEQDSRQEVLRAQDIGDVKGPMPLRILLIRLQMDQRRLEQALRTLEKDRETLERLFPVAAEQERKARARDKEGGVSAAVP